MRQSALSRFGTGILAVALLVVWGIGGSAPAAAQQRREPSLQIIRDAEIEDTIRTFGRPVFEAAGIDPDSITIVLVKDPSLNAFVAGGMNLFLHTGLLMATEDPGQLLGVVAHETGHIAGGHLIRTREAMEGASAQAILATLLGAAAVAAGGRSGGSAGAAVVFGGIEMAQRAMLAYSRAQEATADQAAMSYMDQAGLSSRGMLAFLESLAGEEALPESRQVEFVRTHPLTRDRVATVRHHVETSRHAGKPLPAGWEEMHRRLRAKLLGFVQPQTALARYKPEDPAIPARYARAIAYFQRGDLMRAAPLIDGLIAAEPKNPYFHELKGQMLMENGRLAEAVGPYRKAVELQPGSALLRAELAHVLIERHDPALLGEAIGHLEESLRKERRSPFSWHLMATAYGRQGNHGMAAYALAEEALTKGDKATARSQAQKAEALLPTGSPGWLRAQDIRVQVGGKE